MYQTAINDEFLAIDSRQEKQLIFTLIDLKSGEIVAQLVPEDVNPWYSLVGIHGPLFILQYFENKKNPDLVSYFSLDSQSGELTKIDQPPKVPQVNSPIRITEENQGFSTIKQFLAKELVLGCEYLERQEQVIISYYLKKKEAFGRFIVVLNNGIEALHLQQDSNLKGFAPGSFFTTENHLIFAIQKNEIRIYEI